MKICNSYLEFDPLIRKTKPKSTWLTCKTCNSGYKTIITWYKANKKYNYNYEATITQY
jgi:hypothetical protein